MTRKEYIEKLKERFYYSYKEAEDIALSDARKHASSSSYGPNYQELLDSVLFSDEKNESHIDTLFDKILKEMIAPALPSRDDQKFIQDNIDVVVLFTKEFDVRTITSNDFDGYIIGISARFLKFLEGFTDLFSSVFKIEITEGEIFKLNSDFAPSEFQGLLFEIISPGYYDYKIGKREYQIDDVSHEFWSTVSFYLIQFVLSHEVSHILLGHFENRKPSRKVEKEYEADLLAIQIVYNTIRQSKGRIVHPLIYLIAIEINYHLLSHIALSRNEYNFSYYRRLEKIINSISWVPSTFSSFTLELRSKLFQSCFSRFFKEKEILFSKQATITFDNIWEFEKEIKTLEKDPQLNFSKAQLLFRANKYSDALIAIDKTLEADPFFQKALYLKGVILFIKTKDENGLKSSLQVFNQLLEINHKHFDSLKMKAKLLTHLKRPKAAITCLKIALRILDENETKSIIGSNLTIGWNAKSDLWAKISQIHFNEGNVRLAIKSIDVSMKLSPDVERYTELLEMYQRSKNK